MKQKTPSSQGPHIQRWHAKGFSFLLLLLGSLLVENPESISRVKVKGSVDWNRLSHAAVTRTAGISGACSSRSGGSSALCCSLPRVQAENSVTEGNMTSYWKGNAPDGGETTVNWASHRPPSPAPHREVSKLGLFCAWNERAANSWAGPLVTTEIPMSKLCWNSKHPPKKVKVAENKTCMWSSQVNVSWKDRWPQG